MNWVTTSWRQSIRVKPSGVLSAGFKNRRYSFVTTPIFYVNSSPHIGHLYTAVLADAYCRHRLLKGETELIFSTGTDEHGMKIEKVARELKVDVGKHCHRISEEFRRMSDEFGIGYTDYIRTTEERHKVAVSLFWKELEKRGYIYKRDYEGWYSISDETFVPDTQVTDVVGKDGTSKIKVSTESGHPVEWCKEENYMFRLEQFIPQILKWITSDNPIQPEKFKFQVQSWLEEGFPDLSISRPSSRSKWGIPVPGDSSQVIYVWLDALLNYLTVGGYPQIQRWPTTVQVVGKDILKFHAVYWPAFLLAHGLQLPRRILCHSHWTVDNTKMSKSIGNVVDPFALKERIGGPESLRYFLLSQGVPHSDCNYNEGALIEAVNTALADTLGNLLSRCTTPKVNPCQSFPVYLEEFDRIIPPPAQELKLALKALPDQVDTLYEEFNFYKGCERIQEVLRLANFYVQEQKPWELAKKSPNSPELHALISLVLETLRISGILLLPIIPNMSAIILDRLNVPPQERCWSSIKPFVWEQDTAKEKNLMEKKCHFFPKIRSR